MNNLGLLYMDGRGVARDQAVAIALFRKVAKTGTADAIRHLAKVYRDGIGVPADTSQAEDWQKRADNASSH